MAIKNLQNKYAVLREDRAYQTTLLLKSIIQPDTPERHLWFAVLQRAIMDIDRKDYYNSNWFFTPDNLRPISERLNTFPEVILMILRKHEIWPSARRRTAKIINIPKPKPKPDTNQEFFTHENDEKINQTINSDMDFHYYPDYRHGSASSL